MQYNKTQNTIIQALENESEGLYIKEIAEKTGLSRSTVGRHTEVLEAKRAITSKKIGNAKLFKISKSLNKKG